MSAEDRKVLRTLAEALRSYADGANFPRGRSRGWAGAIDRILSPKVPRYTNAKKLQFLAALTSRIRSELRPNDLGAARSKTSYSSESVRRFESLYAKPIDDWLKRMESNVAYAGLTRKQKLQRELKEIESTD